MKIKTYMLVPMFATLFGCTGNELSSGLNEEDRDTNVLPGNDFYQFACGGWMKNNPLPAEYSRYGSFEAVGELNRKQLRSLIDEMCSIQIHPSGSIAEKISTMYNSYMDSTKLDEDGVAPILPDLSEIDKVNDKAMLMPLIAKMHKIDANMFFSFYISADDKNSDVNLLQSYQSGLGMGRREMYIAADSSDLEKTTERLSKYASHIEKMYKLVSNDDEAAKRVASSVMEIEMRLANAHFTNVELRDPVANYNKMGYSEFKDKFAGVDWDSYFGELGLHEDSLSISQIKPIEEAVKILTEVDLCKIKDYMSWSLINSAAGYLDSKCYDANFDFYGRYITGSDKPQPRWKRAVSLISGTMGEALGEMYVKKFFPEYNKQRMVKLVQNLRDAYAQRIDNLTWMSSETKAKAHEKLTSLTIKIGYPDKFRDYSALVFDGKSLWENIKKARLFESERILSRAGKPVDKTEWHMTPQTVNAYYNPTTNEICFPAGILQRPFFDMEADDAFNYGAIGVVIGHEMTHGYDDQGRQYDSKGNLNNWWTDEDNKQFEERAARLASYFDSIEVASDVFANGKFTLGENLADYGGLCIAYQAFKNANKDNKKKDGFTPEQRFFLSYASVWANNIREQEIIRRTKVDTHSLGKWRVNGALPQIQAWYDAFGITENDPMYLAPEKRPDIW